MPIDTSSGNKSLFQRYGHEISRNPDYEWYKSAMKRLEYLAQLPMGWDGYRAPPVPFANAVFALQTLNSICRPTTVPPQIVPGINGNLQLEWHTEEGDLELNIKSPFNVVAWYSILGANSVEKEIHLTNDFSEILEPLTTITEPVIAQLAAA